MKRVVSLWLPFWPIDLLRREKQKGQSQNGQRPKTAASRAPGNPRPFALTARGPKGPLLHAVDKTAQQAGLGTGLSLADARAQIPELVTAAARPQAEAAALRALADWCGRYSPWTNVDGTHGIWLDITGCAHLFGGEAALLDDLSTRLSGFGLDHRLGLADTPGAAWAAARFGAQPIVGPGAAAEALAPLPVAALRLEDETLLLLKRLGLRRIGQLYDLPRTSLAQRFGRQAASEDVVLRLDQALGRRAEPLSPLRPAPRHRARLAFAEPLLDPQALPRTLEILLDDLCGALAQDQQGARRLRLIAYRVDGSLTDLAIGSGRPTRDATHLARLFRDRLLHIDPQFGIDLLILAAERSAPLGAGQLSLDPGGRGGASADRQSRLIDRLSNHLGAEQVRHSRPVASHLPERAERQPAAWHTGAAATLHKSQTLPGGMPARPFRLFERPEAVQVIAEVPEGPPLQFVWRRVTRQVARAEGPERIAPEWWRDLSGSAQGWHAQIRDYYRVEDVEGRRYWLFRAGLYQDAERHAPPAWFIHGLFA